MVAASKTKVIQKRAGSKRARILVVDDEKSQRELLSKVLSKSFAVETVESLKEAMDRARAEIPDLVILDYDLGDESGIDGIRRFRELGESLPVIMLTGHGDADLVRDAISEGVVEFVLKPFANEDLISAIRSRLKEEGKGADDEVSYSLQRRLAANIDLWRSRLPTAPSENRLVATLDSGKTVEAKILRLNKTSIQAEVYEPSFWMESGRAALNLKAWIGADTAYDGSGKLGTVITTGPASICEFFLDDELTSGRAEKGRMPTMPEDSARTFVARWRDKSQLSSPFKLAISEILILLSELREWLAGVEVSLPVNAGRKVGDERQIMEQIYSQVEPVLTEVFDAFEAEARKVPAGLMGLYAEHVRNCLHPLMLSSPFVHRSFTKPLHYPGDYGVMNYMLGDPFEGESLFSRVLNAFVVRRGAPATYRYRVDYLESSLGAAIQSACERNQRPCRLLSLGCGAAPEVQRLLRASQTGAFAAEFTLLDFSSDTLEYTRSRIEEARPAGGGFKVDAREFSVQQMLASGTRLLNDPGLAKVDFLTRGHFDVLYCVGLFDYLSDRVCERVFEIFWELGAPGAKIVASNFTPDNPDKAFMDYILDWRLLYRGESALRQIASAGRCAEGELATVIAPGGGEVFVNLEKRA